MIFPNIEKVNKKKKNNESDSVATGSLLEYLDSKMNQKTPVKEENNSLVENTALGKIITGIKDSRNETQNTKSKPNQNIINAKSKSDESYNELMEYKKKNNINIFNENSKRVKNDKKYQELLKNAQKDVVNSQKTRQEEFANNLEFDEGVAGGIEKTGMALAGGFATGVSGIESTTQKILGQTPSVEDNELKYGMFNNLSNKAIDETDSEIGKAGLSIANSIGQMIPQLATGNPTGSTITGFANYGGSAYNEAKKNGATEEQATMYGLVSGTIEMSMEKALGGFENTYGKSMAGKFTNNVMNKVIKNKALRKTLSSMSGEFTEEYLQEFLEPILKNAILEEDNGADFWNTMKDDIVEGIKQLGGQLFNKENLYAGTLGAVTSGIMETPHNISRNNWSKKTGRDFDTGYTQNEQKVLDELTNREMYKKSKEQAINTEIENTIKNQSIILSEENRQKIADRIKKEYENKDIDLTNTKLSEKETKKIRESIEKQLQDGSIDTDEITNILGKETDLSKDDYLQRSFYEKSQRSNNYQYEENKDDSEITKALKQSASRVMNNTTKSRNFVDNVSKIAEDKGTRYEFVNNEQLEQMGYDIKGKDINGLVGKDSQGNEKVLINIDSKTSLNKIVGHETTHLLEGTEEYKILQNTIKEYAKSKGDYDDRIKATEDLYSGVEANIENEVTSDLVGEYLFNDEEFINHLSTTEPNVFTKVYDYIKHLYKTVTADSQEARDLEKVKYRFEQAYKENIKNKSTQNTKYSIQEDSQGNKYVNVDTDQDIFNGKNLYEQNKIAKQYILDNFRGKELSISDENVSITRTTANEYTHPRTSLQKKDASSKMKASTELDNLLSISEYKYSKSDDGRHSFAKDGWDYYKTTFKVGNNIYTGLVNIAKNGDKKMLYDITNLKRNTLISSPVNTATESIGIPFSNTNISQSTENVNSDISNNNISNNNANDAKYSLSEENIPIADKYKNNEMLNPVEISNLTNDDAITTPKLPFTKRENGDGNSKFFDNIKDKTNMLSEDSKDKILSEEDVKYYKKVTNEESLIKAFDKLQENRASETMKWFSKKSEQATDIDVAEGWILMKQYEDAKDYDSMVEVAKKMREIGTKAGQTIQAFNIMSRLTPEGMVKYAQSELSEAFETMSKNKTKKWIDENRDKFNLTPEEVQFIINNMQDIQNISNNYDKKVKLAEIQKVMSDKLPPERGAGIKAWMRISMLFNPKTQVRNVLGNAVITPVNVVGDFVASKVDKKISQSTGVRTTGNTSLSSYASGFKKGLYQSYNDFKKGINTREMEGNRFEIGPGKSFNNNKAIGKALNKVDSLLGFMLDAGDRGFYEATFTNSINNQMILNNTTEVTQEMTDIATNEALQRTWQDNNNYTKFVLNVRNMMNNINVKGYGLGDVLIPFAKTPANLTKAIVDYSPVGLVTSINKGVNLKKALSNGQFTSQMQHDFTQSLGKATAGTLLYILGYALAKAKIISGDSDDDKDVANFMKNTLGVSSYSIKIGNKSFSYDWAQPIAAPLSIMANIVQNQEENQDLLENVMSSINTAGNIILEQSFMESIQTVLSNNEGIASGIQEAILDLPARAVPTFLKQIVDYTDGTQRQTFEKDKPLESMINGVKSKIPGLSTTLAPSVDTLGRNIQKYGGKNNLFNVFLNPANLNTENISKSAKEIYDIYKQTGNASVMPRVAPYYINKDGKKINLDSKQRAEYQKISGNLIEENVDNLQNLYEYQQMDNQTKSDVISNIVNYSYAIAQNEVLGTEISNTYKKAKEYYDIGGNISDFYTFKNSIDNTDFETKKESITDFLVDSDLSNKEIAKLYSNYYGNESDLNNLVDIGIPAKEYIKFKSQSFESDIDSKGNTISGSKMKKVVSYVNSLDLSAVQKAMLIKQQYPSFKTYDKQIAQYVNGKDLDFMSKATILKKMGFKQFDKQILSYVKGNYSTIDEQKEILEKMGFTIYTYNGKAYVKG